MIAWFYLFIASLFEIEWTFSLKLLDFKKIKQANWNSSALKKENII